MLKTHYTYIVEQVDTGEFYIGSRSCNGLAVDDTEYMGSMVAWKPNKAKLKKTILNDTFSSRDAAIESEIQNIKENINNPLNRNYNIPGIGFHNTGRIFGDFTKHKMSIARIGNKNPNYGKTHSDETKQKMRLKRLGTTASDELREKLRNAQPSKSVIQYDKNMNFVAEYRSIHDAGNLTKTDKGDISRVCRNKQKTAGGFIWKLKLELN